MKSSARIDEARLAGPGGEPPGFSDCFRAFDDEFDYVCRALRRNGVARGDAEDLAQDVLVVAWRRWSVFDRARPLRPWLAGIAARVARDFLKRRWREVPQSQIQATDPALVGEDQVEASRTRGQVFAALALLPDRHRIAIVLHDFQGLAPHEVAAAMGVPITTAYTRLRRAHLAFAQALARVTKAAAQPPRLVPPSSRRRGLALAIGAAFALSFVSLVAGLRAAPRMQVAHAARAPRPTLPPTLALGLVGYWPFDDAPGSTVARDHSGRGHDCVLHELDPAGAWIDGAVGGAVDLRAGGWLECPQPRVPAGRPAPDMTVMVRVKPTSLPEVHSAVVSREMGIDHDDLFFFGFLGDRLKVSSRAWLGWVSRPVPRRERWSHIAFTRRAGGPTTLYLDGVAVGENQQGERLVASGGDTPLLVGGGHVGFDGSAVRQHFDGVVDDLAVYDRALAPAEIALAAAARTPLTR